MRYLMNYTFPEAPILLYPSLINELGVEAAVLFTIYHQHLRSVAADTQVDEMILSHSQWLALAPFWNEESLAQLTSYLVSEAYIDASFANDGRVRIRLGSVDSQENEPETSEVEMVSRLPVVEDIPAPTPVETASYAEPEYMESRYAADDFPEAQDTPYYPDAAPEEANVNTTTYQNRPGIDMQNSNPGPAPTFGGSIGWAKKVRQGDELQALFQQHEQRNKQLHGMELGWQPSQNLYALLPRHNISHQFAQGCLDEFVLYWLDKDRKETNWDQKFLGWVKREWVKKQTQEGRKQRINNEQKAGFSHEDPRRDTREKRKRVTAAVMDIKDTDW